MTIEGQGRLYEKVADAVRLAIARNQFDIGDRLPAERTLAQTHGVSRPTVREAIIALELDGLVEVRMGSGVYVRARRRRAGPAIEADIGPFELLEARRGIEGESCALAADRITPAELDELGRLVAEMRDENSRDVVMSEKADRRFHLLIAHATQNSAMEAAVTMLWDARERSPQYRSLADKAHAAGVRPRIDEHRAIVEALRGGVAERARAAMQDHLGRVLESLLKATEVHEVEQVRARVNAQRLKYGNPAGEETGARIGPTNLDRRDPLV